MRLQGTYPVLLTEDPRSASGFYVAHLGFVPAFDSDWYVSLKHADAPQHELAFVCHDHPTVPGAGRRTARGVILNFEVTDATALWDRLRDVGVPVLLALRDEPSGQRHFTLRGPGHVMIDEIENIPPAPEFAASYA